MKLGKVELENYRGFFGKNTIEFDTRNKKKNINLLIARNDTGKTTFLNAIYWCLYGNEQIYNSKNSNKRLLSNKKIIETPIDGRMKMSVSLYFSDEKGITCEITRERTYKRLQDDENDLRIMQVGEDHFTGMEANPNGSGLERIEHIKSFVDKNIPIGISSFFLLDGEQLKAIFTSGIEHQIKDAIEKVANINSINAAIETLQDLDRKYSIVKSRADANFGTYQNQVDKYNEEIGKKKKDLNRIIKEVEMHKKEMMELNDFLQNHNETAIRELGLSEQRLFENNERIDMQIRTDEEELNRLVIQSYIAKNADSSLNTTLSKFEEIIASGNFPPAVDPVHVKALLKKRECICGCKIKKDSSEERALEKLANAQSFKEYVRIISEGASWLPQLISSTERNIQKISQLKKNISDNEARLEKNKKELENITQKLKDHNVKEIAEKADKREMIERALDKNKINIDRLNNDIVLGEEYARKAERQLNDLKIKDLKDQQVLRKSEKCKQLIDYLKRIKAEIMKRVKDKIQESTAKNFIELHWKAEDYDKVIISDDFSLSIRDKHGGVITNELSQGAALCFGLAFMTALRNYSGYDVPVIIDSPVGKIDEGNRENIAKHLPEQLSDKQVIFLVTSSEYSSVFKKYLENKVASTIALEYDKKTGGVNIKDGSD